MGSGWTIGAGVEDSGMAETDRNIGTGGAGAATAETPSASAKAPRGSRNPDALKRVGRDEGEMLGRTTTWAQKHDGSIQRSWHVVDATDIPLGRLASHIAVVLMGKHRPEYTAHVDTGDFVIVINGEKVGITGNKALHKYKMRYSGYPGGLRTEPWGRVRDRRPEWLIEDAVKRMLPKNRLGRVMLKKLKVYRGAEHPHGSQRPTEWDLKS